MIKTTISIQRKTVCDCSAYAYPHSVGSGKCIQSISSKPPFCFPKRGLAAKLCNFIDALESEIENSQEVDSISNIINSFKEDIFC